MKYKKQRSQGKAGYAERQGDNRKVIYTLLRSLDSTLRTNGAMKDLTIRSYSY
jgi:hypothetical protein